MNEREIREKVFQALGQASVCWDIIPVGVFDADKAKQIGEDLIIALFPKPASVEEIMDELRVGFLNKNLETSKEKSCSFWVSWEDLIKGIAEQLALSLAKLQIKGEGEIGVLKADEVTLEFFRKYLEMPEGTLEDLCREIIRLKIPTLTSEGLELSAIKKIIANLDEFGYPIDPECELPLLATYVYGYLVDFYEKANKLKPSWTKLIERLEGMKKGYELSNRWSSQKIILEEQNCRVYNQAIDDCKQAILGHGENVK
jgi:hypothetical protein